MPYIAQDRRTHLVAEQPQTVGELNYAITMLLLAYMRNAGSAQPSRGGYALINDCLGALEGAKLEFYRRIAAPYEDTKIAQNGDVYDNNRGRHAG